MMLGMAGHDPDDRPRGDRLVVGQPLPRDLRLVERPDEPGPVGVVEAVDDSSPYYRDETVSFAAAYGTERVPAHLFLPKGVRPPYQEG